MTDLVFLTILGTSIWVYFDAKSNGVKKGQLKGFLDMDAGGWFGVCLLLWIVGFPLYLSKREELKRLNGGGPTGDLRKCPRCAEDIKREAVKCRFCGTHVEAIQVVTGASSNKKGNGGPATVIAAVVVVLLALALLSQLTNFGSISDRSGALTLPQPAFAPAPVVTLAKYNQIREHMTYEQVRNVIGAAGEELSRSNIAGFTTVMYGWTNSNGSNMNAMFQKDSLVTKAQFGLQ